MLALLVYWKKKYWWSCQGWTGTAEALRGWRCSPGRKTLVLALSGGGQLPWGLGGISSSTH